MKVLICNKFYRRFGGPETVVEDTVRLLEADGHEAIPFAMAHPDNWPSKWSDYFVPEIDYHANPGPRGAIREAMNILYSREAKRRIARLLDDARPDIVHAHNIYHQLSPSIFAPAKERGIPVVLTLHDYKLACANALCSVHGEICERCSGGRFYNAVIHKCLFGSRAKSTVCMVEMYLHRFSRIYQKNVDIFVSPSQFLIDLLKRCGAGVERAVHIPNFADVDYYTPTYENDGYILYFGRLSPGKGVKTLIKAISEVKSARLIAAGTGPQADELRAFADEIAPGRVEFAGFLTGEKLKQAIERCAFFVIPSQGYENCPCTVLEAYSGGKPVIASRIGGIPELVDDGVDGFLFEPGNHEELAQKIALLWNNPSALADMGRLGRTRIERNHSPAAHYSRLTNVYRELVPSWPK